MAKSQKVDREELRRVFPELFIKAFESLSVESLAGDVSTRAYFRIRHETGSYVLQCAEIFTEPKRHLFLSMQKLLSSWGVPVPGVVAIAPERGWILLEDMGDQMLIQNPQENLYERAIDVMVLWSVKSLTIPSSQKTRHFEQFFDFEKLNAEMEHTQKYLVEGFLGFSPEWAQAWCSHTRANSAYLAEKARVLCHRDYHSKNIMLKQEDVFVIDFQDARIGSFTYDIVSLLWDPYVRTGEAGRQRLLQYWRQSLLRQGGALPEVQEFFEAKREHAWQVLLERTKIQRLLKAAGTYAAFYMTRGREDYLFCIVPTLKEVEKALEHLAGGESWGDSDKFLAESFSELYTRAQERKRDVRV